MPLSVFKAEASITPEVLPSRLFSKAVARKVSLIVMDTFPNPLIPEESKTLLISEALPLSVFKAEASITPEVLPSRLFRRVAFRIVSLIVIDSFPNPLIPEES